MDTSQSYQSRLSRLPSAEMACFCSTHGSNGGLRSCLKNFTQNTGTETNGYRYA